MFYDKNLIKRRAALILIILFFSLLQNTAGFFPEPFGARAFFLIPLSVYIGMFEKGHAAALLGAFTGMIWDISSGKDGFYAIIMFLTAFVCSLMVSYFMRNNAAAAFVLTAVSLMVNILVCTVVFFVFSGVKNVSCFVLGFYLPSFVYTLLLSPLQYLLIRAVYIHTQEFRGITI